MSAYPLPSSSLLLVPKAGDVGVATSLPGDESSLGDQQGAGFAGTLAVIFNSEVAMNVLGVGAVAGQGCENDPVLQGHVTDFDRLEELASKGHGKLFDSAREKDVVRMLVV